MSVRGSVSINSIECVLFPRARKISMLKKTFSLFVAALVVALLGWGCGSRGRRTDSDLLPDGGLSDGSMGYAGSSGQGSGGKGASGKGGVGGSAGSGAKGSSGNGGVGGSAGSGGVPLDAGGSGGSPGPTCGNNVVDNADEECDGQDLNYASCETLEGNTGVLSCTSDCNYDVSMCGTGGTGGQYGQ